MKSNLDLDFLEDFEKAFKKAEKGFFEQGNNCKDSVILDEATGLEAKNTIWRPLEAKVHSQLRSLQNANDVIDELPMDKDARLAFFK